MTDPEWWRPVIVPPFPVAVPGGGEPPWGDCADCPDPGRCRRDGCHGMDGVELTAAELGEIG